MDWQPFVPQDGDVQESQRTETAACVSFSAIHIIETILKQQTGVEVDFSERALAKLSGTTPQGNSYVNVVNAINKYGLILEEDWPIPTDNYTWDEFYQDIPPTVLAKAKKCPVTLNTNLGSNPLIWLGKAPLWLELQLSTTTHADMLVNPTTVFESYGQLIRPLYAPVIHYFQLTINPMTNAEFVHKTGTKEYGFYLPALSEDAIKDKALNLGTDILGPDGSIDFTKAKEVSGL